MVFSFLKDKFSKKEEKSYDDITDLTVKNLDVGFIFDYETETWQVTAKNRYETDEGEYFEMEIKSSSDVCFLEPGDEDLHTWLITKKIPIGKIGGNVRAHIKKEQDPPDTITYDGVEYYLDASTDGHFFKDCEGEGDPFISWNFLDDSEKKQITIEQWGETEFEASTGLEVEEFRFMNILPASK